MTGRAVLRRSLFDVLRRPREVILIGVLPHLVMAFVVGAGVLLLRAPPGHPSETNPLIEPPGLPWLAAVLPFVATTLLWAWTAVAWHRLVLLGERPRLRVLGSRAYWLYTLYAALLASAGLYMGVMVASRYLHGRGRSAETVDAALRDGLSILDPISLAALVVMMGLFLYLGLFLPGRATDKPLDIGDGVRAASGAEGTILALAPVAALAPLLGSLPRLLIPDLAPLARLPLWALGEGVGVVISASILTTLYGHLVERRPLG